MRDLTPHTPPTKMSSEGAGKTGKTHEKRGKEFHAKTHENESVYCQTKVQDRSEDQTDQHCGSVRNGHLMFHSKFQNSGMGAPEKS